MNTDPTQDYTLGQPYRVCGWNPLRRKWALDVTSNDSRWVLTFTAYTKNGLYKTFDLWQRTNRRES
jgi:hypothetical protein